MDSFEKFTQLELIRWERHVGVQNRHLRQALYVQRNLIEARLEERRLQYLSSLPVFHELSEEMRGLLSFLYVQRRSMFLAQMARGVKKRKLAEQKLAKLRQAEVRGDRA